MVFPEKIWSHYQGAGVIVFSGAAPRLEYLFRLVKRRASRAPSVLNIGVGNGYFETRCQKAGFQVCAIDPVEAAVESLRKQGVDARRALVSAIPFPSGYFDFVVASEVLEHLEDQELSAGVGEIARVLKPGGYFVGTVPYEEKLGEEMIVCPDCGKVFHRWGHVRSFSPLSLQAALETDLGLVRMQVRGFSASRSWRGRAASGVRRILLFLGSHGVNENIVFVFAKRA